MKFSPVQKLRDTTIKLKILTRWRLITWYFVNIPLHWALHYKLCHRSLLIFHKTKVLSLFTLSKCVQFLPILGGSQSDWGQYFMVQFISAIISFFKKVLTFSAVRREASSCMKIGGCRAAAHGRASWRRSCLYTSALSFPCQRTFSVNVFYCKSATHVSFF